MLTLEEIYAAQRRLAPYLYPTLLESAPELGENAWLKLENTNPTHSFKIRGALNAMLKLKESGGAERGVIAASSGNHAQALAYAARLTGVPATIVMPAHTPQRKVNGVRRNGATALLDADNYDEAELLARERSQSLGLTYVSPYNDADVMAGAGTAGLEIIAQCPDVERVLVCTSGGGLLGGIATAVKALKPDCEIIAVCAQHAPAMFNFLNGTQHPEVWETLAEALSGDIEKGSITLEVARKMVDHSVLVSENAIADAMRFLVDVQGWLVEGGGAAATAALLSGAVERDSRHTVCTVSGGNIDLETLRKVLG
jgi:threonine dehydratase